MPRLQVTLPDGSEVAHDLTDDVVTIGRVPDNTVQIEDASVSSHHAELILREDDYSLKDIGSTNGTQLNGNAVQPDEEMQLQNGDAIVFGNISVRYQSETVSHSQPLPEDEGHDLAPATSTIAPKDFANASPFQTKTEKKDPAAVAVLAIGVLALLSALGAIAVVMQMASPF